MTLYHETSPNAFTAWRNQRINDLLLPANIETIWSDAELAEYGLYRPLEADPIPDGMISNGETVQRVNGVVKFVHDLRSAPGPSTDPKDYPLARWQFQAMVDMLGHRSAIEQAINALPSAAEKAVALAKLNHSDQFLRNDPLVATLSYAVGITSTDLDAAWMIAKDLA